MEAKDTVMGKTQRDNIFYHGIGTLEGVCNMQAELSFKAGIKEGVEDTSKMIGRLAAICLPTERRLMSELQRQWWTQLKGWGIEEEQ